MRKIELACDKLYKQREIRGFCHLYDGQVSLFIKNKFPYILIK